MEKDFDFDSIGKNTPYRVPDDFFKKMQDETLRRIDDEKHKHRHLRFVIYSTIAAAAILACVIFIPMSKNNSRVGEGPLTSAIAGKPTDTLTAQVNKSALTMKEVPEVAKIEAAPSVAKSEVRKSKVENRDDEWIEQLSDEDLNSLIALSENDIFLN